MTLTAKSKRGVRARLSTKWLTLTALAFGLVLVALLLFSHRDMYQIYRLRQEKSRLDAENHKLSEENLRVARTIDRLHNDPAMIQDLIRQELNFVKKNEIIIQLSPSERDKPVKAAIIPDRSRTDVQANAEKLRQSQRRRQAPGARKTAP